jgi:uncharacterized protein YecE (DUF72 family)
MNSRRTLVGTCGYSYDDWKGAFYPEGLPKPASLADAGRLAAVLLQLPYSFKRGDDERRYLGALCDALASFPLAVEFRNADAWWTGSAAARYDYLYSEAELRGIVPTIRMVEEKAELLLIAFNNHAKGCSANRGASRPARRPIAPRCKAS